MIDQPLTVGAIFGGLVGAVTFLFKMLQSRYEKELVRQDESHAQLVAEKDRQIAEKNDELQLWRDTLRTALDQSDRVTSVALDASSVLSRVVPPKPRGTR